MHISNDVIYEILGKELSKKQLLDQVDLSFFAEFESIKVKNELFILKKDFYFSREVNITNDEFNLDKIVDKTTTELVKYYSLKLFKLFSNFRKWSITKISNQNFVRFEGLNKKLILIPKKEQSSTWIKDNKLYIVDSFSYLLSLNDDEYHKLCLKFKVGGSGSGSGSGSVSGSGSGSIQQESLKRTYSNTYEEKDGDYNIDISKKKKIQKFVDEKVGVKKENVDLVQKEKDDININTKNYHSEKNSRANKSIELESEIELSQEKKEHDEKQMEEENLSTIFNSIPNSLKSLVLEEQRKDNHSYQDFNIDDF